MQKDKIKIMGISLANRNDSPVAWLVQDSLKVCEEFGERVKKFVRIETELVDLSEQDIHLCLACNDRACMPPGSRAWKGAVRPVFVCVQKSDFLAKELFPKMVQADGYIFGCTTHSLSLSGKFRLLWDRMVAGFWNGWFTSKPATAIAFGYGRDGQETALTDIAAGISIAEMIDVSWIPAGVTAKGLSRDFSSFPAEARQSIMRESMEGYASAQLNARRVAELAVVRQLAQNRLGERYEKEFIQVCHSPHGEAPWEWRHLDKEDQEYLAKL